MRGRSELAHACGRGGGGEHWRRTWDQPNEAALTELEHGRRGIPIVHAAAHDQSVGPQEHVPLVIGALNRHDPHVGVSDHRRGAVTYCRGKGLLVAGAIWGEDHKDVWWCSYGGGT